MQDLNTNNSIKIFQKDFVGKDYIEEIHTNNHVCECCDSTEFTILGNVKMLHKNAMAIRCMKCNHVVKSYIPTGNELMKFYQTISHDDIAIFKNKVKEQLVFIKDNFDIDNIENMLEIGSGPKGIFDFLSSDIKKYALEVDNNAIIKLESKGIKTFTSFDDIDIKFDLIILSHVLEHIVDDIGDYIDKLLSLLSDDGCIFIEVPMSKYELILDNERITNNNFCESHFRSFSKKSFENFLLKKKNIIYKVVEEESSLSKLELSFKKSYSNLIFDIQSKINFKKRLLISLLKIFYFITLTSLFTLLKRLMKKPESSIRVLISKKV